MSHGAVLKWLADCGRWGQVLRRLHCESSSVYQTRAILKVVVDGPGVVDQEYLEKNITIWGNDFRISITTDKVQSNSH